jgi:hypothetical protein
MVIHKNAARFRGSSRKPSETIANGCAKPSERVVNGRGPGGQFALGNRCSRGQRTFDETA